MASKKATIELVPFLDLVAAMPLKESLVEAFDGHSVVEVDGAGVEFVSTPCVQLLLAAKRTAQTSMTDFVIKKPSEAMLTAFKDLGVEAELGKGSM